jgi:hypothetical protein
LQALSTFGDVSYASMIWSLVHGLILCAVASGCSLVIETLTCHNQVVNAIEHAAAMASTAGVYDILAGGRAFASYPHTELFPQATSQLTTNPSSAFIYRNVNSRTMLMGKPATTRFYRPAESLSFKALFSERVRPSSQYHSLHRQLDLRFSLHPLHCRNLRKNTALLRTLAYMVLTSCVPKPAPLSPPLLLRTHPQRKSSL